MGIGFYIGQFIGILFVIFCLFIGVVLFITVWNLDLTGVDKKDKKDKAASD